LKAGKLKYEETVLDGIEQAPAALIGLLQGQNTGKMLVRLAEG
jgi:NADPH-dependent curcumin reductase CurA